MAIDNSKYAQRYNGAPANSFAGTTCFIKTVCIFFIFILLVCFCYICPNAKPVMTSTVAPWNALAQIEPTNYNIEQNKKGLRLAHVQGYNEYNAHGTCGEVALSNALNILEEDQTYNEEIIVSYAFEHNLCDISDDEYLRGGTTSGQLVQILDGVAGDKGYVVARFIGFESLDSDEVIELVEDGYLVLTNICQKVVQENFCIDEEQEYQINHWLLFSGAGEKYDGTPVMYCVDSSGWYLKDLTYGEFKECRDNIPGFDAGDSDVVVVGRKK